MSAQSRETSRSQLILKNDSGFAMLFNLLQQYRASSRNLRSASEPPAITCNAIDLLQKYATLLSLLHNTELRLASGNTYMDRPYIHAMPLSLLHTRNAIQPLATTSRFISHQGTPTRIAHTYMAQVDLHDDSQHPFTRPQIDSKANDQSEKLVGKLKRPWRQGLADKSSSQTSHYNTEQGSTTQPVQCSLRKHDEPT
jgi:hypothetical protein